MHVTLDESLIVFGKELSMLFFVYIVITQSGLEPDKAKFFNEIISQILNQIAPPASKLCCISLTSKMMKKVKNVFDSFEAPGPHCVPLVASRR